VADVPKKTDNHVDPAGGPEHRVGNDRKNGQLPMIGDTPDNESQCRASLAFVMSLQLMPLDSVPSHH
jgi:hypothetical protein